MDRRNLIHEAAAKSFSLYGYKATTMEQVAKLANVGKGTIYTFYKTKEELFEEIIKTLIFDIKMAVEEVLDENASFHENVHRVLFMIHEFRESHQLTIKLIQEERDMGTQTVVEAMQQIEQAIVQYMMGIIQKAIEMGEIKSCDPEITAFVMLKMYFSLIVDWQRNHPPLGKEEISKLFELYLLKGLSTK
ncbi:TetR/AcrR family transcriptional regulator [Bacillus sp. MRMR6]|uniref:TetR/AcrR family transcriptional regulator n=1 Tax=Bacillus sp. MRMR6 TaxID=1928617 RepID=UPI000950F40A|nr:TetR/AcrR family transcriptional regulator [Bacillus sp. MRMR6]OLS41377.1 TetR family transcriptional regulator [Bacillus sp. MRMR6]